MLRWLGAVECLFGFACARPHASPAAPSAAPDAAPAVVKSAPVAHAAPADDLIFLDMCDASGAVALSENVFVIAGGFRPNGLAILWEA